MYFRDDREQMERSPEWFHAQFADMLANAMVTLGMPVETWYRATNDQLQEAARVAAESVVGARKTVDELVAAAMDPKNPHQLTSVNPTVTEANFGSVRPLRHNPVTVQVRELALSGWQEHPHVYAYIDRYFARPTMAEVLDYAINGWDGETTVLFIEENDNLGCLCHAPGTAIRRLHLPSISEDWYEDDRLLVFDK